MVEMILLATICQVDLTPKLLFLLAGTRDKCWAKTKSKGTTR